MYWQAGLGGFLDRARKPSPVWPAHGLPQFMAAVVVGAAAVVGAAEMGEAYLRLDDLLTTLMGGADQLRQPRPADAASHLGAVPVTAWTGDNNDTVGILDLLALLANWGQCA